MKGRLELASEALGLLAAAVLLYRITVPDGPEPLEVLRGAWADARGWVRSQRQYRAAMLETLERIRDLPETEGES